MAQMECTRFASPEPGPREALLGRPAVLGLEVTAHKQEALEKGRSFSWPRSCGAPSPRGSLPQPPPPHFLRLDFPHASRLVPGSLPLLCFLQGTGV